MRCYEREYHKTNRYFPKTSPIHPAPLGIPNCKVAGYRTEGRSKPEEFLKFLSDER
jgi:hypothetical protein